MALSFRGRDAASRRQGPGTLNAHSCNGAIPHRNRASRTRRQAEETMSDTVSTLLLRNLHEVFGEGDPVRRRAVIDEIFREDAVFHEPKAAYRGRDEIDRI